MRQTHTAIVHGMQAWRSCPSVLRGIEAVAKPDPTRVSGYPKIPQASTRQDDSARSPTSMSTTLSLSLLLLLVLSLLPLTRQLSRASTMNPHISLPRQHAGPSTFGSAPANRGSSIRTPRFFKRSALLLLRVASRALVAVLLVRLCADIFPRPECSSSRKWTSRWRFGR